jgi:N-acetylglucosamine-6-phosphate deacetylase
MIISAHSAVIDGQMRTNVWIEIQDGLITAIGEGENPNTQQKFSQTLIPGFVDIHCHGGGGYYFADPLPAHVEKVIRTHRAAGTTSQIASLVTTDLTTLTQQIKALIPFVKRGELSGIHLEGPYLSHAKCGAHDPALLRAPALDEVKGLIAAGEGTIRMVTIAPELEGALESIQWLVSQGVIAAIGHSDANADTARAAIDAGAQVVTHFTNAMAKMVGGQSMATEVLEGSEIALELINDGTHVPADVIATMMKKANDRIILITDAMSAAGSADGKYAIGNLDVEVKDAIARLSSNGALAGSTLTMEKAFLNFINKDGADLLTAVHASSTLPAKILGLKDVGNIAVGNKANILAFDGKKIELLTF